jgi:hypothetical protein
MGHETGKTQSMASTSIKTRAIRSAASGSTSTPGLGSSTPFLPFLGNRLALIDYVPNGATVSTTTQAYAVVLARQPDCSIQEDFVFKSAPTPNAALISSAPSAQDYFHQLSGLATTADVFPKGCAVTPLGLPTNSFVLLGSTSQDASIGALIDNAGLQVLVADPVANKSTLTTLDATVQGAVSAADLNGDGVLDLVATFVKDPATQKQSTAVFLGNGDGTFKPTIYYDVAGDITIDDVNGDTKPDIIVLTGPGVTTLIGKGDGTFTVGPSSATNLGLIPGQAEAQALTGDFNGDGKKDLLVDGTVLLGVGDGTFTVGSAVTNDPTVSFENSVPSAAVGDINNDGKLDIVVSQPGFVALFYGRGDGTFSAGPRYASLPDFMQATITDIDGDGNPDILLGSSAFGNYASGGYDLPLPLSQILMGRGDGTFVDSVSYDQGGFNANPSLGAQQISTADFNGDGKPDALVFRSNFLTVLPGDGTGRLGTAIASQINFTPGQLVVADMNGDKNPDVVFANGSTVGVVLNQGNGTFAAEKDYALPASGVVSLAVGDFNGDGLLDVAVGVSSATTGQGGAHGVYVLMGQSNGTLGAPVLIDSSLDPVGLAAGDLNGDGRADLVIGDEGSFSPGTSSQVNGGLHLYLGNANGTFTTAAAPATAATNYTVVALGDLNKDGKPDIIVGGNGVATAGATATPNVYTFLGNGDGTFQAPQIVTLGGTDGVGANSVALADINNDGNLDVVVGNLFDFTEVLFGQGNGALSDSLLALGQRPNAIAAADLNGDGFPELLVGNLNGSGIGASLTVFMNANAWGTPSVAPTSTALSVTPNPATAGQSVTLTATVTSTATGTPTGTVAFMDGTTTLGSMALSAQGSATFTTSTLAVATHSLSAQYSGDASFTGSTSNAVSLVVTSAPAKVSVPNVVGLTQAAATSAITAAGLVVGTVSVQPSSTVAAGHVINQAPSAGSSVATGSSVNLVVSSGVTKVLVPDVVGLTRSAATAALVKADLVVGKVTLKSSLTVAAGIVLRESPAAGASVTPKSAVELVVSSGSALEVDYSQLQSATHAASISPAKLKQTLISLIAISEQLAGEREFRHALAKLDEYEDIVEAARGSEISRATREHLLRLAHRVREELEELRNEHRG